MRTADWVLLTPKNPRRIPWNQALHGYFRRHFGFVRHEDTAKHQNPYNLFARDGIGPAGPSRRAAIRAGPAITPDVAPGWPGFVTVAW